VFSLACIIPVMGDTDGLETTLLSVLERRTGDCEVLVVLNSPYNDPYRLQGEIQFLQAPQGTGLVDCVNLGIAATNAQIVHLLTTGYEVDHHWTEHALAHFEDACVAAVTPLIYDRSNDGQLLAAGMGYGQGGKKIICRSTPTANDSSLSSVGPLLQAAFYRKCALQSLGALPTAVGDELADVDVALSLHSTGWRTALEPGCRVFAPSVAEGSPTGFLSGLRSERLYWRHFADVGSITEILAHAFFGLKDILRCRPWWKAPAQALGRFIATCQLGHYRKHRQLLAKARSDAAAQSQLQIQLEESPPQRSTMHNAHRRTDASHPGAQPHKSHSTASKAPSTKGYRFWP
jgi:hypothetical protein